MNLYPEVLEKILFKDFGVCKSQTIVIAYSGGCDSQVLLHNMAMIARNDLAIQIVAAHYDHGLEKNSKEWVKTCRHWAREIGVQFVSCSAGKLLLSSSNKEARGRELRYRWLASLANPDGVVVTAHHADDQAETFLNRMFRGGDFAQLSGIRISRPIFYGSTVQLLRPMLGFSRQQIQTYAREHNLEWIDDPSNSRNDVDRNLLRNRLLPVLYARGKISRERLVEATEFCREISQDEEKLQSEKLLQIVEPSAKSILCLIDPINLSKMNLTDENLIVRLIRLWIHQSGRSSPSDKQFKSLIEQMKTSSSGYAELSIGDEHIRYFDRKVYLTKRIRAQYVKPGNVSWNVGISNLQKIGINIQWITSDIGLPQCWIIPSNRLELSWHCGKKFIKLPLRSTSSMIRKIQQSNRIPPWERRIIPCILFQGRIVWVYGVGATVDIEARDTVEQKLLPRLIPLS
ncbi:MAG: tRNA lysidine(34) synthetase TilS [Gammaproteobacteria bacterium]|nr:tRNA lysidine(34) synthetase TilS [Gammaproteobacteria bacterium]MCY4274515.1 tRNA lysidine(34) synthetase TilS [Gammaproteobacteria bacterium]